MRVKNGKMRVNIEILTYNSVDLFRHSQNYFINKIFLSNDEKMRVIFLTYKREFFLDIPSKITNINLENLRRVKQGVKS